MTGTPTPPTTTDRKPGRPLPRPSRGALIALAAVVVLIAGLMTGEADPSEAEEAASQDPASACTGVDGTYSLVGPFVWKCAKSYPSLMDGSADWHHFTAALAPACDADVALGGGIGRDGSFFECGTHAASQLRELCSTTDSTGASLSPSGVVCKTQDPADPAAEPSATGERYQEICLEAGGAYSDEPSDAMVTYSCSAA